MVRPQRQWCFEIQPITELVYRVVAILQVLKAYEQGLRCLMIYKEKLVTYLIGKTQKPQIDTPVFLLPYIVLKNMRVFRDLLAPSTCLTHIDTQYFGFF